MGNLIRRRVATPEPPDGGLFFTSPKGNLEFIHTGNPVLDCVIGGGWVLGRVSNVVGDKSTSKTLLAIEACINFFRQFPKGAVRYVEAESAWDDDYARAIGLAVDRVEFRRDIETIEQLFEDMEEFLDKRSSTKPGLYIVDSLDSLTDAKELERKISDGTFGAAKAKQLGQLFRRLIRRIEEGRTHFMIISQVRDNIGAMFGEKHTRSGGKSLDFYASQILWLAHMKTLKKVVDKIERAVAITVKAKCKKNKVGLPFRDCLFDVRFGYGVEDIEACFAFLEASGKVPADLLTITSMKKLRGNAMTEARAALAAAVTKRWYEVEKKFVPAEGKYS